MSMQALNHLVARSIVDPSVVSAFGAGDLDPILCDLGFSGELRTSLSGLQASSWAEFAVAGLPGGPGVRNAGEPLPAAFAAGGPEAAMPTTSGREHVGMILDRPGRAPLVPAQSGARTRRISRGGGAAGSG